MRSIELRGDVIQVAPLRFGGPPRWRYLCPVCGLMSRPWTDHSRAFGAGLDHEERGLCSRFRAGRLSF